MKKLLLAVSLALASAALAHDHDRPELNEWFSGLKSHSGGLCCSGHDGTALDDPDWNVTEYAGQPPHYRVRLDGQWIDVPDEAVVTEPNRAGHAMVWPYSVWRGGEHTYGIRCFMPGAMT